MVGAQQVSRVDVGDAILRFFGLSSSIGFDPAAVPSGRIRAAPYRQDGRQEKGHACRETLWFP